MRILSLIGALLCSVLLYGQGYEGRQGVYAHNSYWLPNKGTIRVFLVFAEALNDPKDPGWDNDDWRRGEIPKRADSYFDPSFEGEEKLKAFMTEYFYYASFGQYLVVGDYYPKLIQVEYKQMRGNGAFNIIDSLNALPGEDLVTANGYTLNGADFDTWKTKSKYGLPSLAETDGYIDMLVVLWRVNSRVSPSDQSGYIVCNLLTRPIKEKKGFMTYSQFVSITSYAHEIMKHEYSHSLYGGNNFHNSGAGYGYRTFMQSAGGFSNMSSWDHNLPSWNAWDRQRMGWKPEGHQFQVSSSVGRHNVRQKTEMNIKNFPMGGVFVLKDFISSNDAIQIKLPHLKKPVYNQYLWLENHQKQNKFDDNKYVNPGIHAYIQVGKDDPSSYGGPGNYTMPVPASGRWDFKFHKKDDKMHQMELDPELSNPLSGANLLMRYAIDKNSDGTIAVKELWNPSQILINEQLIEHYPVFGNNTDAFSMSNTSTISLDDNPSPNAILTYATPQPKNRPPSDNDTIYLNGLSVELIEDNVDGQGAIEVSIRWDDYKIQNDLRWCGNIVLQADMDDPLKRNSDVLVFPGVQIKLDRSLTPLKHKAVKQGDQTYFSDPSRLLIRKGGSMRLFGRAKLELIEGSSLILEEGGELIMGARSALKLVSYEQIKFKGGKIRILGKTKDVIITELDESDLKLLSQVKYKKFKKMYPETEKRAIKDLGL